MAADCEIRLLGSDDLMLFREHFTRHRAESGRGDWHFMPFAPDDRTGPAGMDPRRIHVPLTVPGWQRWFGAFVDGGSSIVGHVDIKADLLTAALHRCELGIGIERAHRGRGLGKRLMNTAIQYARDAESIAWLDLKVFAHNTPARALYRSLGFVEIGIVVDRFRIEGVSIDDVVMTLDVAN